MHTALTTTLIFAKAPIPGQVKTRLCPALDPSMAARVYVRLLRRTVDQAVAASLGPVCLVASPDCAHPVLAGLIEEYGLLGAVQTGADLGQRMYNAMHAVLAPDSPCILVGSDCLDLDAGDLCRAAAALHAGTDLVLGPSCDGGYVLIGARRLHERLFAAIPWSTARVMASTRCAVRALGWSWVELGPFRDLDHPRDLALIPHRWRLP